MPTQSRSFPPKNIGRFTYLNYFHPSRFVLPVREPLQHLLQKQFQLLLHAPRTIWDSAVVRTNAPIDGDLNLDEIDEEGEAIEIFPAVRVRLADIPNRQMFALEYYVEHDKEWEQDAHSWSVFKKLTKHERQQIRELSTKKWDHRSQWTWNTLLPTIARDQHFFREALIEGPTGAGLVETKRADRDPLWQKHNLSQTTARRIYDTYNRQLLCLLGEGALPPKSLRVELRRLGYLDARDRFPGNPIEADLIGKSARQRKRFSDLGIHFFAHALRNLQNWRYGKKLIPSTPYACMKSCLDLQQRLAQRPPR